MSEPLPILMEKALQIAWDYLEQTGQIDDPEITSRLLLDTVEHMVRCGERRRLALSNGAATYERLRVCPGTSNGITEFSEHEAD